MAAIIPQMSRGGVCACGGYVEKSAASGSVK